MSKVTSLRISPRSFNAEDVALAIAWAAEIISDKDVKGFAQYNIESDDYSITLQWDTDEQGARETGTGTPTATGTAPDRQGHERLDD